MAALIGDVIYVAGGSPAEAGRALEAYDPAADRWTPLPPMPTARNHLAGGAIEGRLHVVGGRPPLTLNVVEAFDPVSATWSTRAPLSTGRSGHAAAVVRGCLYVPRRRGQRERALGRLSPEGGLRSADGHLGEAGTHADAAPRDRSGGPRRPDLRPRRSRRPGLRRHRRSRGVHGPQRQELLLTRGRLAHCDGVAQLAQRLHRRLAPGGLAAETGLDTLAPAMTDRPTIRPAAPANEAAIVAIGASSCATATPTSSPPTLPTPSCERIGCKEEGIPSSPRWARRSSAATCCGPTTPGAALTSPTRPTP